MSYNQHVNKKALVIFFGIPVLIYTGILFYSNQASLGTSNNEAIRQQQDAAKESSLSATNLTGEQFIQLFAQVINQKQINTAVAMLNSSLRADQKSSDQWTAQFNSINAITVKDLSLISPPNNPANTEEYKVNLTVQTSPEAANAPIPFYGWNNGDNIRFITIIKGEDKLWRVQSISTGQ